VPAPMFASASAPLGSPRPILTLNSPAPRP
jgi:hypothetical protein